MGTEEILRAIQNGAHFVKRVVITSSFAAVINTRDHVPFYTSDMWNPISIQQALQGGPAAYVGSKKFAEQAAWDFMKTEKPGFTLSTINPVLVFGPVMSHLKSFNSINTSNARFTDMIQGKMKSGIEPELFWWVDVRDVALAHMRAIEVPGAAGKRFLAVAGRFSNEEIAQILKTNFPDLASKLPAEISVPNEGEPYKIDTTPMNEILGISFRPLKECVVDTVGSLLKNIG